MGLALVKEKNNNGVYRKDFEEALVKLSDIARLAEQKLTIKVDNFIEEQYKKQNQKVESLKNKLQSIG